MTVFGTEVFLGKLWVEGPGAKIEADKVELPPRKRESDRR